MEASPSREEEAKKEKFPKNCFIGDFPEEKFGRWPGEKIKIRANFGEI